MTGGVGRKELSNFYRYHFIWSNPEGTRLELVSRTIGIDRVIDEFIFILTHNTIVDWLYILITIDYTIFLHTNII